VKIVRVRTETIETEHPIAFTIVQKKDTDLTEGKQKVVKTGKQGVLVKKMERVFEDGKLIREQMVKEAVVQPAVQQVVSVGAKKKAVAVTLAMRNDAISTKGRTLKLNGRSINVKHMLANVTLTAYSAGPSSTGKSKGDAGYGVTASGAKVQEGRTIAVDRDVIPLGWWVYIEGIGFRRAEDTGSAINGKKIDVYYDSHSKASKFGRKKGYTVYVIGPVKPTGD
jgi:3D (Asp-Asp-Asp) domain-containing protein